MEKKIATPGTWKSWISAQMLSESLRFGDVQFSREGNLVWSEGRSGKTVLVMKPESDAFVEVTSEEAVRGGVGYGGGEFTVANETVFFSTKDGKLFRKPLEGYRSKAITPAYGGVAAPAASPDGKWVAYVFSDGHNDCLGIVDAEGRYWPSKLVQGSDFFMQPVWHPAGNYIAWIEWDHPNMPWDTTRICLGTIDWSPSGEPRISDKKILVNQEDVFVSQPQFSPDGRYLSYLSSETEWDDLILYDLETKEITKLVEGDGAMLSKPAWVQGNREYAWSPESDQIYFLQNQDAITTLWVVDVEQGQKRQIDVSPYTYLHQLTVSPKDGSLAFIASSPMVQDRIIQLTGQQMRIIRRASAENIPASMLPIQKPIQWETQNGINVHGIYYPPSNSDYELNALPPVIVNIHGGPTSQQYIRFHTLAAYFTSRGYGWFEVNYRGSTGYGKQYQKALYGQWGAVDVEDAIGAAQALIDQKLADPDRLVIMGGSAGGYTVLNALVQSPGTFAAGIDMYGVSDLFSLAVDTHKFELHYTDQMVGPLPDATKLYREWSPVFHADKIQDPVAVFQGSEDVVVPPNQSEMIVAELKKNGIPHIYKVYDGEGHGFRKNETRSDLMKSVDQFIQKHVIFA